MRKPSRESSSCFHFFFVIPAQAGIQFLKRIKRKIDSRFRGNDDKEVKSFPYSRESSVFTFLSFLILRHMKKPYVYILASQRNGTLYTGVTSNLGQRMEQHRAKTVEGFSKRYFVHRLVWYEEHENMINAIAREKAIKKWRRAWKLQLIEQVNPEWHDLTEDLMIL